MKKISIILVFTVLLNLLVACGQKIEENNEDSTQDTPPYISCELDSVETLNNWLLENFKNAENLYTLYFNENSFFEELSNDKSGYDAKYYAYTEAQQIACNKYENYSYYERLKIELPWDLKYKYEDQFNSTLKFKDVFFELLDEYYANYPDFEELSESLTFDVWSVNLEVKYNVTPTSVFRGDKIDLTGLECEKSHYCMFDGMIEMTERYFNDVINISLRVVGSYNFPYTSKPDVWGAEIENTYFLTDGILRDFVNHLTVLNVVED